MPPIASAASSTISSTISSTAASAASSSSPVVTASSVSECVVSLMPAYFVKRSVISFPKARFSTKIRAIMMISVVSTTDV